MLRGVELEIQPVELDAIAFSLNGVAMFELLHLRVAGVLVPLDDYRDLGDLVQNLVGLIAVDVAEHHNQIGAAFEFCDLFAHRIHHRQDLPRADLFRGRKVPHEVAHQHADDGDAHSGHLANDVAAPGEEVAIVAHHARRHEGKMSRFCKRLDVLPAVIELVITQSGNVGAEEVEDLVNRQPVEQGRDGRALHQIARVEIETGHAAFALMPELGGEISEAAAAVGVRLQVRV